MKKEENGEEEDRKAFALRIRVDIWKEIQSCAAEDFRSVNSEIEVLLREALKARGRLKPKG